MNIIFMGTPQFGRTVLESLYREHNITLVVTQPDTYKGKKVIFNPVKEFAIEHNLPVFQPEKIRKEHDVILNTPCDLIVTAAFGQIVPEVVLYYPKYKSVNVHGSLLPKYRGGAPIQRSIMNGDKETGITLMYMEKGMDSGDILEQQSINIEGLTADEVFINLANLGASMINPLIKRLVNGEVTPIKQDESEVTFAYNLQKEEEQIDFTKDAFTVIQQVRGLSSNPGAFFTLDGNIYKVYQGENTSTNGNVGSIIEVTKDYIVIGCGKGSVKFSSIRPQGKNTMLFRDFYNGKGKELFKVNLEVNK